MKSHSDKDALPGALSLEQQFKLKIVKDQVGSLSLDQAQAYVVEVMRQMMVKDNLVKHILKNA
ncbi:MAG: NblA/ycf18 family protein [Cyanobacteria bacterium P01_F01_bin.53]